MNAAEIVSLMIGLTGAVILIVLILKRYIERFNEKYPLNNTTTEDLK